MSSMSPSPKMRVLCPLCRQHVGCRELTPPNVITDMHTYRDERCEGSGIIVPAEGGVSS